MNKCHIEKLREIHRDNKLVPFIGAGLSLPFGIPGWAELIKIIAQKYVETDLIPAIYKSLERYDYWKAIDDIKYFGNINEFKIQQETSDIIRSRKPVVIEDEKHNYKDIADLGCQNYLTTNYDFLLNKYISNTDSIPQILHKVEINSQNLFGSQSHSQIWHLHGHVQDIGSIVLSQQKYDELYSSNKYKDLFRLFQGNGIFLFIGFSFNDQFIRMLLQENNKSYNSEHYILLDNPKEEVKNLFCEEYGINIIEYNSKLSSHAEEIRKILNEIKKATCSKTDDRGETLKTLDIPLTIPTSEEKNKMENNLFCKKIKIEHIDEFTLDYSKECFFTSDILVRTLRKKGFSEEIISYILTICYMKYKEIKGKIYKYNKNSQLFIDEVHNALEIMEYPLLNSILEKKYHPHDFQNKGFIHILADDLKKDVWWGGNRINGQ